GPSPKKKRLPVRIWRRSEPTRAISRVFDFEVQEQRIRIFVADDHPVVRGGLIGILNAQPGLIVVGEAEDGESAVERFCELLPDIGIIDLQMPKLDGVAVIRAIRLRLKDARLITLTAYDTEEDIQQSLRAGA